jgi:16S rRNA (adenine1518-N6/adenine1519-N6)-dimethyltransferase
MTFSAQQVRRLLAEHDIRPSRSRGQNFVVDPNTVRRIARLAEVGPGDRVVEIGAGVGSLTLALTETGAHVTAVEVDRRLVAVLRQVLPEDVSLVQADALTLDWREVLGEEGPWVLVANLPYNIAATLVLEILDEVPAITRMLVMVQREVAERLAARTGDDAYGATSVKVAYWATAELAGNVPRRVFLPVPNVDSALVRIVRRPRPLGSAVERAWLFTLVSAGFRQRRKMLRRSLAGLASVEDIEAAELRPESRAEELDLAAWRRLAACTASRRTPS